MNKRNPGIIFLFCALAALSVIVTAAAENDAISVTGAAVNHWNLLRLTEKYATAEYLEKIAGMLPQSVTVSLSNGQTAEASVKNAWTLDMDNSRWVNSVNLSELPAGTEDPDGVLNEIAVAWQVDNYTGSFSILQSAQVIGQKGTFRLGRYMFDTSQVEFWQIPSNGDPTVLRATQDSEGIFDNEYYWEYTIDAWTTQDSGQWMALYGYYGSSSRYFVGVIDVEAEANKAVKSAPNGWTLFRLTERYTTPEYLNIIADMLPKTVTVTLLDEQAIDVPTLGKWTPDIENSRWINEADVSMLPAGIEDPDGVLKEVSLAWQVDDHTGAFSVSPSAQVINQEGYFRLYRYMLGTNYVQFWQIPSNGDPVVLRATQDSAGFSDDGHSCKYVIDAWTAQDSGYWIGLYGFGASGSMYLAGVTEATPKTYTITLRPNGGVLQGSDIYQTVLVNGMYYLENIPPEPVRANYKFEGWYTEAAGGDLINLTKQTNFNQDMTLYAHWSRLSGDIPSSIISNGKELKTTEVAGVSGTNSSVDNVYNPYYRGLMLANLYQNSDENFITVDNISLNDGDSVVVTFWDRNFQQMKQKEISMELPLFGGFFHGEKYNYLVFGQDNEEEDNDKEVLRLVKYDQNFNRVSAASVRDCYTCDPFHAGSCRMAEQGNYLTIHTARLRYLTPDDGLHHQSQLTVVINTDTMEVENDLGAFQGNHVSHSFNQFVIYDGEEHVLVDHGDAYPRGVILGRSYVDDLWGLSYKRVNLFKIPGPTGDNYTGVSVGGLEQSDDFYLVAINTVNQSAVEYAADGSFNHTLDSDERNIVLLSCSKYMDSSSVRQDFMTNYYKTGTTAGVPYLVQAGKNRYVMLWQEFVKGEDRWGLASYQNQGVRYVIINGNADILSDAIFLPDAQLSRYCQPVFDGENIVWYVDENGADDQENKRTFYRLSLTGDNQDPEPTEPEIENIQMSDNLITVKINGDLPENAILSAAVYQADGKFIEAYIIEADTGSISIPVDNMANNQSAFVRAFLTDEFYKPLCLPKQTDIK